MAREKITITNDFHRTEATVLAGKLSPRTVARVRNQLCGMKGCTCAAGELGQRGRQREADIIEPRSDGTVEVYRQWMVFADSPIQSIESLVGGYLHRDEAIEVARDLFRVRPGDPELPWGTAVAVRDLAGDAIWRRVSWKGPRPC